MKIVYENMGHIIGFLVIVIFFLMATDEKTAQTMVALVLLGAVLLNSDTLIKWLQKF